MKPIVSIIIVNWNGKKWLKECLTSLTTQTYKEYEIILVDNASTDGSGEYVKKHFPSIVFVESKTNRGFAGGNNLGLQWAKGKYILLLNNDTRVKRSFLKEFIKAFTEIPNLGSVQSKIVLMQNPEILDNVGSYWTDSSFLYHYGYGKNQALPQYNKPLPFFSNKGASMFIRRDVIEKIGLFDDDFWCYYEETDFCHRAWLAGYECWYYPRAVVYHAMGGTSLQFDNAYIQFHNFKNKLLSFLKNFQISSLLTIVPLYLIINIVLSIAWVLQGKWKHSLALYQAVWWNIVHFPQTRIKRHAIQKLRRISDKEIFKRTKQNPRMMYYVALFTGKGLEQYHD